MRRMGKIHRVVCAEYKNKKKHQYRYSETTVIAFDPESCGISISRSIRMQNVCVYNILCACVLRVYIIILQLCKKVRNNNVADENAGLSPEGRLDFFYYYCYVGLRFLFISAPKTVSRVRPDS